MCHMFYFIAGVHFLSSKCVNMWHTYLAQVFRSANISLLRNFHGRLYTSRCIVSTPAFSDQTFMSPPHLTQSKAHERYESRNLPISRHTGTPYPCKSSDLHELQNRHGTLADLDPRISIRDAARLLESKHSKSPNSKAHSALRRLRRLHDIKQSGEWYADVPFKIFGDIDEGLFDGDMRAKIHRRWVTDNMAPDMAHRAAWTSQPLGRSHPSWWGERVCVSLNARKLLLEGALYTFVGVVVQECVVSSFRI